MRVSFKVTAVYLVGLYDEVQVFEYTCTLPPTLKGATNFARLCFPEASSLTVEQI
jgi:hypothetical protein